MFRPTPVSPTTLQFASERQLQDYCLAVLKSKNITAREEVWCGSVRADIVTDRMVMELKKVLDRAAIYQAYGQAMVYQKFLNKAEVWIVGQTPIDAAERATAFTVAREISAHNIKVSFIESDPFWQLQSIAVPSRFNFFNRFTLSRQGLAILSIISIAFIVSSIDLPRLRSSQDEAVNSSSIAAVPPSVVPVPSVAIASSAPTPVSPPVRLSMCNGGSVANFRRSPSLSAPLVGTLEAGNTVTLTGRMAQVDGVNWVEVIDSANQVGWVAACFLGQ